MVHISKSTKDTLTRSELRKFGLILGGGLVTIFGVVLPILKGGNIRLLHWPWLIALVLTIVSLIAPMSLKPLNKAWLFLGNILGYINTRIILGIIFLLLFTPFAFALKLLKKDLMRRKLLPGQKSYRIKSQQPKTENLNRPY